MYVGDFEGLLYSIFSEETFKSQRFHTTEETDDYTISDSVFQHFGMIIVETMTCITCHQNNPSRILKYDSFIYNWYKFHTKRNIETR